MKSIKYVFVVLIVTLMSSCSQDDDFLTGKDAFFDCLDDDCGPILIGPPGGGTGTSNGNGNGDEHNWPSYFYTHKGQTSRNIYYSTSTTGEPNSWTQYQLGLGAQSSSGPASVLFKNKRYLFYKGGSSENVFMATRETPTSSWQGNNWINDTSKTDFPVSATVFDDKIFVAHRGLNNSLYLSYSSTGDAPYTQIQPITTGENVREFCIVTNGDKMFIFWTKQTNTSNDRRKIYYRYSETPTDESSWQYDETILEVEGDPFYSTAAENGLSAVALNGKIYMAFGRQFAVEFPNPRERHVAFGILDENEVWTWRYYDYRTQRRPGIMLTEDSNLLISFAGEYNHDVYTMKVDLDGDVLSAPIETGGATKRGGVNSFSCF